MDGLGLQKFGHADHSLFPAKAALLPSAERELHRTKPEIVDVDDVEMLEDLLMAALNNAYAEADEMHDEKMGAFGGAGGMF